MKKENFIFRGIFKDRKLLYSLSKQDFKKRFAGSYFGIAWAFFQPALTILVYLFVFQFGFRSMDVGDKPYILWFMCGIVPWLFISEAFSNASNSFIEYSYLVKKVIFNIDILPLVKIISSFYIHLFFIGVVILICIILGYYPSFMIIQLLYYVFCTIVFVFAISLIFSSVMVFFRDLNQIINILLLIGMWGTPIAWNIEMFSYKVQFILKLNPVYYLVEGYRDSILNNVAFWDKPFLSLYFWIITLTLLYLGANIFKRLKMHFSDTL